MPVCNSGTCGFQCQTGWGDCDRAPANGCEINLNTNDENCGSCNIFLMSMPGTDVNSLQPQWCAAVKTDASGVPRNYACKQWLSERCVGGRCLNCTGVEAPLLPTDPSTLDSCCATDPLSSSSFPSCCEYFSDPSQRFLCQTCVAVDSLDLCDCNDSSQCCVDLAGNKQYCMQPPIICN